MAYQWRAYTAAGHSHWMPAAAVVLVRVMQLSSCALNTTRHSILLDIYQLNTSSIFLSFVKCFSIVTAVVMSSQTLFTVTQETLHKLRLQSVRVSSAANPRQHCSRHRSHCYTCHELELSTAVAPSVSPCQHYGTVCLLTSLTLHQ